VKRAIRGSATAATASALLLVAGLVGALGSDFDLAAVEIGFMQKKGVLDGVSLKKLHIRIALGVSLLVIRDGNAANRATGEEEGIEIVSRCAVVDVANEDGALVCFLTRFKLVSLFALSRSRLLAHHV
jgi:hypothetical protein